MPWLKRAFISHSSFILERVYIIISLTIWRNWNGNIKSAYSTCKVLRVQKWQKLFRKTKKSCCVYGQWVITACQVRKWISSFRSGDIILTDEPRLKCSSDLDQCTLRELVKCNTCKRIWEISTWPKHIQIQRRLIGSMEIFYENFPHSSIGETLSFSMITRYLF